MYTCLCVCACMYTHTHAHSVKHKITCVKSDIPCVYLQPSYSPVYSVKINLIKCLCVLGGNAREEKQEIITTDQQKLIQTFTGLKMFCFFLTQRCKPQLFSTSQTYPFFRCILSYFCFQFFYVTLNSGKLFL